MSGGSANCLFQFTEETYDGAFKAELLEQYKLYVQSAENVSARRVASNRYLLTLNAALVALYGLQSAGFGQSYWTLLIPVIGIPISLLWYWIIKSHADLNRVKFGLIHEFEQHLPAALYRREWQLADEGRGKSYRAVTTIERWIPILFAALHIVLALLNQSQGEMYISPDRTVGRPQFGRKGDMRRRGVLEIVFETPEMHIPPWYWFSSCGQRQPDIGEGQPPLGPVLQTEDRAYRTAFGLQDSIAPCTDRIASWPGHQEGLQPAGVK